MKNKKKKKKGEINFSYGQVKLKFYFVVKFKLGIKEEPQFKLKVQNETGIGN